MSAKFISPQSEMDMSNEKVDAPIMLCISCSEWLTYLATVSTCIDDKDTELVTGVTTDVLQRANSTKLL